MKAPVSGTSPTPSALPAGSISLPSKLLWGAGLVGIYLVLEWISFIHEYKGLPITPWNPGVGVLFALMILFGWRYAAVLFLGALAAEFVVVQSDLPPVLVVAISAVIAVGYGVIAWEIRRRLMIDVVLNRLRDIVILLVTGVSGAAIVALLLTLALFAGGELPFEDIIDAATPLFIGDAIGIAVMTPLTLRLIGRVGGWSFSAWPGMLPEFGFHIAVVALIFWGSGNLEDGSGLKFFYLFVLPVVVASVRHGLDGACIGLCLIQLILVALSHIHGYDATAFTEAQLLMLLLTTTGLIIGVVVSERQAIDRIMREAQARLKQKEAEAAQAARLTLMSGMASALAHEINQPMTAARALARAVQELLKKPGGDMARADANLATLIAQIDHAGDVIRRMRDFMRRGRPHVSTVAVRDLLEDSLILVRDAARTKGVRIDLELAESLPNVHADAVQLQQVIVNLVQNAVESIASAKERDGRIWIAVVPSAAPPRLEFRIRDNGTGLDDQVALHLFEPLTTSKSEGLGLGLAICASIVQSHGGRIWLESGARGTTEFRFWIPVDGSASP